MNNKLKQYGFLFHELVKRDFTKKYKRTTLGIGWSLLSPLLSLLIMWLVLSRFFGSNINHYIVYLFSGQIVFSYFVDSTNLSMSALVSNAGIFTKVNVPKYLFVFSQSVSSFINFCLTFILLLLCVWFDGVSFSRKFILLLYPIICLVVFNVGVGLILSALHVFFRDMQYLWGILTQMLSWMSAIFYSIDSYSYLVRCLFLLNPLYLYIRYFRKIILEGTIPTLQFHILAAFYAFVAFFVGCWMYKRYNHDFLYYL